MAIPQEATDVVNYIALVLLCCSIVCAFLTILTFLVFREIRTYPIKLIMYLCVCIMFGFFFFVIADQEWITQTWACIPCAVLIHYFFLGNFCWTFCIAFNFYQMIVRRNRESQLLEKWYHLGCWCFPAFVCTLTGAIPPHSYGPVGGGASTVCYINEALARFLAFFIPGLIIIAANTVLFFFIGREIHETLAGAPQSDQRDRKKEFRVYISIFISIGLSWIFGYMMFLIPEEHVRFVFFVLFAISTPMQGVLIFLSYCANKKVASKWVGLMRCIPFCAGLEEKWDTKSGSSRSSRHSGSSRSASASASASASSSSMM
eukprot:TRINITY_DN627_c0_g1_i1.p2 TRINITY_DN627_c0_g1~~TRINITY_DN627_c0_g1_i1.p2  ORF type:complete len:317 (+),score=88.69 TRINITY_DN627_c0_g1_i1:215-1165(+)